MLAILLLSCGSDPEFVVENKTTPTFTVVNKTTPQATDPRGVWSPYWDGSVWQPRWLKEGVSQPAIPKASPGSIPTTSATGVGHTSTTFPGSTGTAPILTFAPGAGTLGVTDNCPPSG